MEGSLYQHLPPEPRLQKERGSIAVLTAFATKAPGGHHASVCRSWWLFLGELRAGGGSWRDSTRNAVLAGQRSMALCTLRHVGFIIDFCAVMLLVHYHTLTIHVPMRLQQTWQLLCLSTVSWSFRPYMVRRLATGWWGGAGGRQGLHASPSQAVFL